MTIAVKFIVAIVLAVVMVYFASIAIKSFFNLRALYNKDNAFDITKQREGILLNNETGRLEADQSIILPFE